MVVLVGAGGVFLALIVLPDLEGITWTKVKSAERGELTTDAGQPDPAVVFSWSRTIGLWIAALGTFAIMSFLWGDNVFYKLAEAVVVGASAAYAMVVGFWTGIIQNLFGKLIPSVMRDTVLPGLPVTQAQIDADKVLNAIGKAIKPSEEELSHNVRSRSSVLRVAEKR